MSTVDTSAARAHELDGQDPLREYRGLFSIPRTGDVVRPAPGTPGPERPDEPCVYLCGNSLGLMPAAAKASVMQELDDWARLGVEGHFHAKHPWLPYHEELRPLAARLVGARDHEVVIMNSLTVNLHLMMASFYRPAAPGGSGRFKIMIEDACFPSDSYAVQSQAAWHGHDPSRAIVRLRPRTGEHALRTEDIQASIQEHGPELALIMLGGVNYLTGQVTDMRAITRAGHEAGAIVGWDLAHAAGNVELHLHDWEADFACWCSYKYLNSGPGAVAGCFVHERHTKKTGSFGAADFLPRLAGWWGNDPKTRFIMGPDFTPVASADAWQLSNPPIMALAPVRASLEIFDRATMPALRAKSERLTGYLRGLIQSIPGADALIEVITPDEPLRRGCQLSIAVKQDARQFHAALGQQGVVCDFREPNVVRVAPVPLYNSFHDCWRFAQVLRAHLERTRGGVA